MLCSGKIYYDIDAAPKREETENVAVARVELLYPFAKEQLIELIGTYPNLKEIVWTQEEPRNMGAWSVMQRRMPELLPEGVELGYVGRPPRASPGEGYAVAHTKEQERIVLTSLMGKADPAAARERSYAGPTNAARLITATTMEWPQSGQVLSLAQERCSAAQPGQV